MAVVNLLSYGDEVTVASCGDFGDRWIKIAEGYGAKVTSVSVKWEKVVKPVEMEQALKYQSRLHDIYGNFNRGCKRY